MTGTKKCKFPEKKVQSPLKAHTISNKLVSKVFALKKGEKSYDIYKYVFKFRCRPPPPFVLILAYPYALPRHVHPVLASLDIAGLVSFNYHSIDIVEEFPALYFSM